MNQCVSTVISLFTVENGEIKVLLKKRNEDPYKGYWMLPDGELNLEFDLDEGAKENLFLVTGIQHVDLDQFYTFGTKNRMDGTTRNFAVGYIGVVNKNQIEGLDPLKELEWFSTSVFPKLAFDHEEVLTRAIEVMRNKLRNTVVLKQLLPGTFTLPELQKLYETILGHPIDRRNFRKKFLHLGIIEETGFMDKKKSGRPAKLYLLKEELENKDLF